MTVEGIGLGLIAGSIALGLAGIAVAIARAQSRSVAARSIYFLVAALGGTIGGYAYLADPAQFPLLASLWVAAVFTFVAGIPYYLAHIREMQRRTYLGEEYVPLPPVPLKARTYGVAALIIAVVFLAATDFELASGATAGTITGPLDSVVAGWTAAVCSEWFVLVVFVPMAVTLLAQRDRIPPRLQPVLALQTASMVAAPTALEGGYWVVASSVGAGVLMVTLYAYLILLVSSDLRVDPAVVDYSLQLVAVYAVLSTAILLWVVFHSSIQLGATTAYLAWLFFT